VWYEAFRAVGVFGLLLFARVGFYEGVARFCDSGALWCIVQHSFFWVGFLSDLMSHFGTAIFIVVGLGFVRCVSRVECASVWGVYFFES